MSRILIVDDEPDILLMLRLNLEAVGHEVLMAADGEMALERIDVDGPELVVLDVLMPVLDGWGVLERLQQRAGAPPVVVVSAKTGVRDIETAMRLGAVDYVTKPFDPDLLIQKLEQTLGR
jgi:two-component system alkaline phosphatase synthesis response regulator PhoP